MQLLEQNDLPTIVACIRKCFLNLIISTVAVQQLEEILHRCSAGSSSSLHHAMHFDRMNSLHRQNIEPVPELM